MVFSDEIIKEISQYQNKEISSNNNSDAVLYIFMSSIASVLAITNHSSDASELIQRILELEQTIGYAHLAPIFIQEQVTREKQLFYIFYADQTISFQK